MKRSTHAIAVLALAGWTPAYAQVKATDPAAVQEVVVTATPSQTQTLIDRKSFSITNDLQATTGSAADVLSRVPSLAVDADGNVSLRGDSNVTILIDGKPSAQFSGATQGLSLQQFSAGDIDRVEVITTPPAQFRAEGAGGVINIVTKKTRHAGLTGSTQLSLGDKRRYVAGVNANYNIGRYRFSGGLGLRQESRERKVISNRLVTDLNTKSPVASQQYLDERMRRRLPSVKASVDVELNAQQSVNASLSHRELSGIRYFDQQNSSGPVLGPSSSATNRHSDGHEWSVDASQSLRFDQKLWRPGETLSLGLQRSVTRERERYAYLNTATIPSGAGSTRDALHLTLDLVKTEVSADYDLPLGEERDLKLGYNFEQDRNAFGHLADDIDPANGAAIPNLAATSHFRYRQQVNALYGQYQTPFGAWTVQTGLRLESAKAKTLQISGNIPGGRSDTGVYPSLHVQRPLGEGKLSFGISRRLSRPDPESLNPFVDRQDIHNLRAGNPDLAPQSTWLTEAGYNGVAMGVTYGVTAYARFNRNSVTDIVRVVSDDVFLSTKTNLPKSRAEGLELTANGKIGPRLSYNLSGNLFKAELDAAALGDKGLQSTNGFDLKGSLDWRPTAADTAQISVNRTDKRLTPQGYVTATNIVNLGFKHQVKPDLAVVATVSDVFNGQNTKRLITTPQLQDFYERRQLGRTGLIGLVYTFGGPAKAAGRTFEYDQ